MLPTLQWCANNFFDVANVASLRGRSKGDRFAFEVGTTRTSDTMDVIGWVIGEIVVYDQCDARDIYATRCDVCGNKYTVVSLLKSFESCTALPEGFIGVNLRSAEIIFVQCSCDSLCTMLGARKDKDLPFVLLEK